MSHHRDTETQRTQRKTRQDARLKSCSYPCSLCNLWPMIQSFDGGEFNAYLSLPASGYGPGIVVLQEIFGVNAYLRSVADWYSAHGFVALVPDLFWRLQPGVELTEADRGKAIELYMQLDEAKAVEDSAAALNFLRQHPACSGRAGAVGFCLGGRLAYLL